MQQRKKVPPGLRLTIELIGRELRDVYSAREKLPPQLRDLLTELERRSMTTSDRRNQSHPNDDEGGE
jgi:hypothetical protein